MQKNIFSKEFKEFPGSEAIIIPGSKQILIKNEEKLDIYDENLVKKIQ